MREGDLFDCFKTDSKRRMGKFYKNVLVACAVFGGVVMSSCANRGMPEGGPKDEMPPVVVHELPASGTVNFKAKQVDIHFDEYVQLRKIYPGDVCRFIETQHDLHVGFRGCYRG